jgi:type I restriction enzyme S subunit
MENGKCAVVPNILGGLGFGSTEFHVLRASQQVNPRFIWHYLRQENFRRLAKESMTGSVGQARVPAAFLRNLPIELPPRPIQDEIVRVLDISTTKGRGAVTHLSSSRQAIERFRQAVLTAACSGRLTPEFRESQEDSSAVFGLLRAHAQLNAANPYNRRRTKPAFGLAIPDQTDSFPSGWAYCSVRELVEYRAIIDIQDGNHGELYPRKTDFGTEGVPFISAESVDRMVSIDTAPRLRQEVADRLRIGFAQAGDVILTHNATVGRVAILPSDAPAVILSTSTTYYRTHPDVLLNEYLALFMRSIFFQAQLSSIMEQTTRNQVPVTKQVELRLAVPTMKEQRAIVHRAYRLLQLADGLMSRMNVASRRVERSSDAVLAKAFRGELISVGVEAHPTMGT